MKKALNFSIFLLILIIFAGASVYADTPVAEPMHDIKMKHGEHMHDDLKDQKRLDVGITEHLGSIIPLDTVFTTSDGKKVRLGDLITKPTIIAPVYYSCPNVCNFLQSRLASVVPQINLEAGKQFQILSVSFDENDTPALAAEKKVNYMQAAGGKIPPAGWIFLTGDKKNIDRLMNSVGFRFARQGKDFLHPVSVITVSHTGKIIRYLYGTDILPFELSMSVVEAQKETPGLSVKKLVAYCFSYDPKGKKYVFDIMRVSGFVVLFVILVFASYLFFGGKKKN